MRQKIQPKNFSTAAIRVYNFFNRFSRQKAFYRDIFSRSIKPPRNERCLSNAYTAQISDYDYLITPTVKTAVYNKRETDLSKMHLY